MARVKFDKFVATVLKSVHVLGNLLLEVVEIQESHLTFRGTWSPLKNWLILKRKPSVAVLMYDLKACKVILVEQLRVAVGETLFEIPAGSMEADANPYTVARYEVREEVGAFIEHPVLIDSGYFSPGATDEYLFLFASEINIAESTVVDGSLTGVVKEGEDIRVHIVDFETFFKMDLNDIKTKYARMWLKSKLSE